MKELIVLNKPKSPISEAYRGIRTNFQYLNMDNQVRSLLVTSAMAGEGKTVTLCNLAITLCDAGHRVLLVDCDLRKPNVHKVFGVDNSYGFSDVLVHGEFFPKVLHTALYRNLFVLTAGKTLGSPSDLFCSPHLVPILAELRDSYDYVLFDTPPVNLVPDATILAQHTDGVVLVCSAAKVSLEDAKKAKEALEQVGATLIGAVVNKLPVKNKKFFVYHGSKSR